MYYSTLGLLYYMRKVFLRITHGAYAYLLDKTSVQRPGGRPLAVQSLSTVLRFSERPDAREDTLGRQYCL